MEPGDHDILTSLREECITLQTRLVQQQEQEELLQKATNSDPQTEHTKLLKALLQCTRQEEETTLPASEDLLRQFNLATLTTNTKQLRSLIKHHTEKQIFYKSEIERKTSREKQLVGIKDSLMSKINQHLTEQAPDAEQHKNLQRETDNLFKRFLKEMSTFIQKTYPPPKNKDLQQVTARKFKVAHLQNQQQADEIMSLQDLLETLISKAVKSKHDPYIDVTNEHWVPYLEMLLRYDIIQRNPHSDTQVKLTPYEVDC